MITFDGVVKEYTVCNRPKLDYQTKIFYSGSACMYPEYNQVDPNDPNCREDSAYPAAPDSEYGWEKLFSVRGYISLTIVIMVFLLGLLVTITSSDQKERGLEEEKKHQQQSVGRLHTQDQNDTIDVWGDGKQTRSFLFIDECIEATRRLMDSDFIGPVNIGSEEMVTINQLVDTAAKVAGKTDSIRII